MSQTTEISIKTNSKCLDTAPSLPAVSISEEKNATCTCYRMSLTSHSDPLTFASLLLSLVNCGCHSIEEDVACSADALWARHAIFAYSLRQDGKRQEVGIVVMACVHFSTLLPKGGNEVDVYMLLRKKWRVLVLPRVLSGHHKLFRFPSPDRPLFFWKSKKKITCKVTSKEASTLIYKHTILSY